MAPDGAFEIDDQAVVSAGRIFISKQAMLINSATEVRNAIENNEPLTALVDKKVISFIKENNIYGKDLLK